MASGGQKRTRSERVAALELPPNKWARIWAGVRRPDVLARLGFAVATALVLALIVRAWQQPFALRTGFVPSANITSRVAFRVEDPAATRAQQDRARWQVPYVFSHDRKPVDRLRDQFENTVLEIMAAAGDDHLPDPQVWLDFLPKPAAGDNPDSGESQRRFDQFRQSLTGEDKVQRLLDTVAQALEEFDRFGRLRNLEQKKELESRLGEGNQDKIAVFEAGEPENKILVRISDVLIGGADSLREGLTRRLEDVGMADLAEPVFLWLHRHMPDTLALDELATEQALKAAEAAVPPAMVAYRPGDTLISAGEPLDAEDIKLLRAEHAAFNAARGPAGKLCRFLAVTALLLGLFALVGFYLYNGRRQLLAEPMRLGVVAAAGVIAVCLALWGANDAWRAEIIPMLLFAQVIGIAYDRQTAVLLAIVVALVVTLGLGQPLPMFLVWVGITTTAVLQLTRIRTRSKLIYVGLFSSIAAMALSVVAGVLENQPLGPGTWSAAARNGLWTITAGFAMTGLLPFVERLFGVLTDMSLLELGDVSHPLLQELVRRAPSTYSHSITVGAIAEAAADAIGARGLLVRVGAYFHDIGKMLKPAYFIENQPPNENHHESLVPEMSTLVIVAHIKDGANLARQHRLPQPIIDFIEQHHGTTLVEYFYGRASQRRQADPNGGEVEEASFRYPGPKPQSKETAVLMLADAAESACRSLIDPGPARIESLVREIAERKLQDGQFDESGLTLHELRTIENSMIKSLIANYHGRLKYPEPRPA